MGAEGGLSLLPLLRGLQSCHGSHISIEGMVWPQGVWLFGLLERKARSQVALIILRYVSLVEKGFLEGFHWEAGFQVSSMFSKTKNAFSHRSPVSRLPAPQIWGTRRTNDPLSLPSPVELFTRPASLQPYTYQ